MSITKAAERVHLSPGAVSLQLRNLAEELNTDLFVKQDKRLHPTPAALLLFDRSKLLMEQARTLEEDFKNEPSKDSRPVHFATGATALINQLGRPLRLLRKRFPNTSIQITVTATEQMVTGLRNRVFDLALVMLPYPTKGLKTLPLFNEELVIIRPFSDAARKSQVRKIQTFGSGIKAVSFALTAKQHAADHRRFFCSHWR